MSLPNHKLNNFHIICLPERLGRQHSAQVWAELKPLLNKTKQHVLLDMTHISRLDLGGVTLLIDVLAQMRSLSGTLALMRVHPAVQAFLELTQTNRLIPVFSDEQAALAGFK